MCLLSLPNLIDQGVLVDFHFQGSKPSNVFQIYLEKGHIDNYALGQDKQATTALKWTAVPSLSRNLCGGSSFEAKRVDWIFIYAPQR